MTEQQQDHRAEAAAAAREISLLAPFIFGRTLRRWYLRKLIDHHIKSALSELRTAEAHQETARYFLGLATAARGNLEDMEGK